MQDRPTFGDPSFERAKVFVICVCLRTQPKNFQKLLLKKPNFLVSGKTITIQFSYMGKCLS